jgi:hypothetical protein
MPSIPHEVFIKQVLPIPKNVQIRNAKDVDMSKSAYLSLANTNNNGWGIEAIYSTGFGGCTGIISLENDEYLAIPNPKIRETHFDPIQLSNDSEVACKLTCIPPCSPIIIFAPFMYIKNDEGKYEKILHPNLSKMIDKYIKYRTSNYQIFKYPASENHYFGCTYDQTTKEAKVYTSTSNEPVYTHVFE